MRKWLLSVGSYLVLGVLSLRYRLEVRGLEAIGKDKGVLFLPNHPAEIEPILIYNLLARRFRPRPLVIEHFYYLKGARFFMNLIRALPIPNFDLSTNSWKVRQVEKALGKVEAKIKEGENFLIYPSGHLKREGHENIGGNSFIHSILGQCPDLTVVLVRSDGLWGSSFSCAMSEESPDFWKGVVRGIKKVILSGIFFLPRRKVTITFEKNPEGFPRQGSRLELNQFLERWYNQYQDGEKVVTSEPLHLVSYSCFRKDLLQIKEREKKQESQTKIAIPEDVRSEVNRFLTKLSGMKEIKEEMDLARDLGLDSLDLASCHAFLDQRFDVEAKVVHAIKTVYDLLALASGKSEEKKEEETPLDSKEFWPDEKGRKPLKYPEGKTLPECFLETAERMSGFIACGDEMTGAMSYKKMKLAIYLLAKKFQKVEGNYVGVMLPSSVGCFLIVFALLMARKVPVMLNWTAGERSLRFGVELLGLKEIYSSRRFLERVDVLEMGDLDEKIVLMEDVKAKISLKEKLAALFLSKGEKEKWMKRFQLDSIRGEDPAVILFTSGTENYPKAVPLSHDNLLSSHRKTAECIKINETDILYGALPPFHSFGFSLTGLFPLLYGLRVFYAPDPTDTHAMARDSFAKKITIHCLAPSFYKNLFRIAAARQLRTVRLFVSGAEKTPQVLFEHVKQLGKEMIEGYGITECSPIVTLNRQGEAPQGVGKPIPGVALCVIHPETLKKLPDDQEGEICIYGPNVFAGYLGKEAKNPFIEIDGKKWYRSGDIGHLEKEGALILGGRLKRFVKIGGEMVSLVALEEELHAYAKEKGLIKGNEEEPQLTVGVKEGDKPSLILFTTFALPKEEANEALKRSGFARIVKVAATHQIEAIPMTGTGKVQLRTINELIRKQDVKDI